MNPIQTLNWPFALHALVAYWPNRLITEQALVSGYPHMMEHLFYHMMKTLSRRYPNVPIIENGITDNHSFSIYAVSHQGLVYQQELMTALNGAFDHINAQTFATEQAIVCQEISETHHMGLAVQRYNNERFLGAKASEKDILGQVADIESLSWSQFRHFVDAVQGQHRLIRAQPAQLAHAKGPLVLTMPEQVDYLLETLNCGNKQILSLSFRVDERHHSGYLYLLLLEYLLKYSRIKNLNDLVRDQYGLSYGFRAYRNYLGHYGALTLFCVSEKRIPAALMDEIQQWIHSEALFDADEVSYCLERINLDTFFYRNAAETSKTLATLVDRYGLDLVERSLFQPLVLTDGPAVAGNLVPWAA